MSRSRKKNPAGGIAKARSEKRFKSHTSRVTRRRNKIRIREGQEPLEVHELVNQFAGPKDGHTWFGWEIVKKFPDLVRK
jgi:hypothetical protein